MAKLKDDKLISVDIWRHLVNFWAIVLYVLILADFFTRNGLVDFLGPISSIYIAVLAVYSTQKEFERWHDYNIGRHPGEVYVFVWTVLIIILLALEVIYRHVYKLPGEVFMTYIVVIGILAITKRSKSSYLSKKRK